jgi:hypothetical protein
MAAQASPGTLAHRLIDLIVLRLYSRRCNAETGAYLRNDLPVGQTP